MAMPLDLFLREVRSQNLDLQAEKASAQAAHSNAIGLALPPPMAGITQMRDRTGEAVGFEISQSIPFPGKLASDHNARKAEADARSAAHASFERDLVANAKLLYFNLWKAQERIVLLKEKRNAIERHLKLTKAATRSDSFLKIHLVKTESDLDLLQNEILQAEQDRRERQFEAAQLLNREPGDFNLTARDFPLSPLPSEKTLREPKQLEVRRLEFEFLKNREHEAKVSWLPDFNLRYRVMGGTEMTPRYSEIMVAASLPFLYFWEPNSASHKASAERARGEHLLEQEKRRIQSRLEMLRTRAGSIKLQLDQIQEKLLSKAQKRIRLVQNLAPRDLETLQDHRETMELFSELRLKALDLRQQYEEAVAEIEKYAVGELP